MEHAKHRKHYNELQQLLNHNDAKRRCISRPHILFELNNRIHASGLPNQKYLEIFLCHSILFKQ